MQVIMRRHLKKDKRGVSNIIVVVLSLIIVVVIVANVILWSYQMNQLDWEKMQENVSIENVIGGSLASYNPSGYMLGGSTQYVSGSLTDLQSDNGVYMQFRSYVSTYSNITMISDGFEDTVDWDANWDQNGVTDWDQSTTQKKSGSYSAHAGSADNDLISDDLDMTDVVSIYVEFWYYKVGLDANDALLQYYDGSAYDTIVDFLNIGTDSVWSFYSQNVTDSQYFRSNFRVKYEGTSIDANEHLYIDDVVIKKKVATEYTSEVEFVGTSNTQSWNQLVWTINSAWTTNNVSVTLQLFNYTLGAYPTSGNGYISYTSSATPNTDETKNQTITINPTHFRDVSGNWKMKIKGVKSTSVPFDSKVDWVEFKPPLGGASFTFKNKGALTSHIISLWMINSTYHQRYSVDVFLNSGKTLSYFRADISLPSGQYVVKIVTERGNAAVYSEG